MPSSGLRARALLALACLLGFVSIACSPTLDWREVRPAGAGLLALFPCRPSQDSRVVALGGAPLRLNLQSCQAGGASFALSFTDTLDPSAVAPTIEALRVAAAGNVAGQATVVADSAVPGMTPNPQARRIRIDGRLPDGTVVREELLLFVRGTVVFQATVLGPHLDPTAIDTFFEGFRLGV